MRVGVGVYSGGPSGVPVSVLETAAALIAAGADVTMLATADAAVPHGFPGGDERVVRLQPLPRALRDPRVEQALHLPHRLMLGRRVARAVEPLDLDVLHVFSPGVAAVLPRGLPLVVQSWFSPPTLRGRMRTMAPFAPRGPMLPVRLLAEAQAHAADRLGYRRASLVLANTETAASALRAAGIPTRLVPPAIAVPDAPAVRGTGPLRVVFCAYNLSGPRKGLALLLEALRELPPGRIRLTLVGGSAERIREPIEQAVEAGTEVDVRGLVPRAAFLDLLAREADLLAVPSLYEEWGYVAFEALSRGVPVLALRRYPFDEVLDAETGLLAARAEPAALAEALRRALDGGLPDPATVQSATRRRYGSAAIAPRLLEAYAAAISA